MCLALKGGRRLAGGASIVRLGCAARRARIGERTICPPDQKAASVEGEVVIGCAPGEGAVFAQNAVRDIDFLRSESVQRRP
jgi:hypothetical protein